MRGDGIDLTPHRLDTDASEREPGKRKENTTLSAPPSEAPGGVRVSQRQEVEGGCPGPGEGAVRVSWGQSLFGKMESSGDGHADGHTTT